MNKQTLVLIAEFVFENRENVPEGFYININMLLKNIYVHGNDLVKFHELLDQNDNLVTQQIKLRFFPKPSYFALVLDFLSFAPFVF
jgi:hypothetical protein